jgi:hypothetical protein
MVADRVHRAPQQRVAGAMTVCVVLSLRADDLDVGDGQQLRRSTGAVDIVIEVDQARGTRARAGQRSASAIASLWRNASRSARARNRSRAACSRSIAACSRANMQIAWPLRRSHGLRLAGTRPAATRTRSASRSAFDRAGVRPLCERRAAELCVDRWDLIDP